MEVSAQSPQKIKYHMWEAIEIMLSLVTQMLIKIILI